MPGQSQLEVIKPNGEIEFYPLDPQKGVFHLGSDPRNDRVIDGPGVKPFHACLDYRQKPAQFILLDQASALPAGPIAGLSTLELAGYIFVVLEEPQVASPIPYAEEEPKETEKHEEESSL